MSIIKKFKPKNIILSMMYRGYLSFLPDSLFLKLKYRLIFSKKLDLNNPQSFNEKIQWLKLHDRKDIYTTMVDKYLVKDYVKNIIGEEYIIPTYGVYQNFDDINFSELPNQFVIKCNHDSASVIVCKDKSTFDIKEARKKINKCLKSNFYTYSREWVYKNVKPLIIVEKYIDPVHDEYMQDYKFFCFNGKPEFIYLSRGMDKHEHATMCFYDTEFNMIPIKRKDYKWADLKPKKPKNYKKMLEIVSKLSEGMCHLRVDLYNVDGAIYFGEITFYTSGGFIQFENEEDDIMLGSYIDLKGIKNEK